MKYLIIKDLKTNFSWSKMLGTICIFLAIFFFFAYGFSDYMIEKRAIDQVTIGVVDQENSITSQALINSFENNDQFTSLFKIELGTQEALQSKYQEDRLSAIVTIPEGFSNSLLHYENLPLSIILNPNHPLKISIITNVFESFSDYIKYVDAATYSVYTNLKALNDPNIDASEINDFFSVDMIFKALSRNNIFEYKTVSTFPSSNSSSYFLCSTIVLLIIALSSYGTDLFLKEARQGNLQRYLTTHSPVSSFILSKILVVSMKSFAQFLVFFTIASLFFPPDSTLSWLVIVVIGFSAIFMFTALSALIGIIFSNANISSILTNVFILVLCLIGGNFFPIQLMPKAIQNISMVTPNYWLIKGILYTYTGVQSLLPLVVLLFTVTGSLLIIAAMTFLLRRDSFVQYLCTS